MPWHMPCAASVCLVCQCFAACLNVSMSWWGAGMHKACGLARGQCTPRVPWPLLQASSVLDAISQSRYLHCCKVEKGSRTYVCMRVHGCNREVAHTHTTSEARAAALGTHSGTEPFSVSHSMLDRHLLQWYHLWAQAQVQGAQAPDAVR